MANAPTGTAAGDPTYLIHTFEHRAYPLTGGLSLTIGRDADCDIVVNEVFVSRHQAELRPEGDDYVLYSTGSNPTMLNEEPMTAPHTLWEGDSFLVGTMKFVFTRERLPVAMAIATSDSPSSRVTTGVDDRRPTLMLRINPPGSTSRSGDNRMLWLVVALTLIALTAVAYVLR